MNGHGQAQGSFDAGTNEPMRIDPNARFLRSMFARRSPGTLGPAVSIDPGCFSSAHLCAASAQSRAFTGGPGTVAARREDTLSS